MHILNDISLRKILHYLTHICYILTLQRFIAINLSHVWFLFVIKHTHRRYIPLRELQCTINLVSVFRVSDYRRKRFEPHISHELLRSDNAANNALMALAQRDAMLDCAAWLASGNTVAVSIHGTRVCDSFPHVIIFIEKPQNCYSRRITLPFH